MYIDASFFITHSCMLLPLESHETLYVFINSGINMNAHLNAES
jgi:hypothetical protein